MEHRNLKCQRNISDTEKNEVLRTYIFLKSGNFARKQHGSCLINGTDDICLFVLVLKHVTLDVLVSMSEL